MSLILKTEPTLTDHPDLASLKNIKSLPGKVRTLSNNVGLVIEIGGHQSSVLRFLPPLIITEEQANEICNIFKEAVVAAETLLLENKVSDN